MNLRNTMKDGDPTFTGVVERFCGRISAPQGTMLRLRPPNMSRAPRQAYISTSHWKRGLKAKEERPMLEKPSPSTRVRRRVKLAITVATIGVKTRPQPNPVQQRKQFKQHSNTYIFKLY